MYVCVCVCVYIYHFLGEEMCMASYVLLLQLSVLYTIPVVDIVEFPCIIGEACIRWCIH